MGISSEEEGSRVGKKKETMGPALLVHTCMLIHEVKLVLKQDRKGTGESKFLSEPRSKDQGQHGAYRKFACLEDCKQVGSNRGRNPGLRTISMDT